MTEEEKIQNQTDEGYDVVTSYNNVPYFIIEDDLSELHRSEYYAEAEQIINLYNKYRKGESFKTEGTNADYIASDLRYKKASSIINKEARFLFANPPTFSINVNDVTADVKKQNTILQDYLNKVLKKSLFNSKLIKASKDCFIGKRIAIVLNVSEETGISITFLNSLEFLYEKNEAEELTKIVMFYNQNDTNYKQDQRWLKKTYELVEGIVYVEEYIYNGLGELIEELTPRRSTKFEYIPASVILNDGLTGDMKGESELAYLLGYEKHYSKLANADVDAERKSMNPTKYIIDGSRNSTANLSTGPGAVWDIQSDQDGINESAKASVGILEPAMNYSNALKTTLDRLDNTMYAEVDVPNINSEQLQGVITSGKTISALYWGLTVRCDEKMLAWEPAFELIARAIIDGGKLYPKAIKKYTNELQLPDIEYDILVENNYPLPSDEESEKNMDLAEVNAMVMSKKAYIKKWRELSDEDADAELEQIKKEQDFFNNSEMLPDTVEYNNSLGNDTEGMDDSEDVDLDSDEFALDEDDDSEITQMFDDFLNEINSESEEE